MCLQYLLFPLPVSFLFWRVMQPQFVFWTDLILFALEYKKTPTSASPVPSVLTGETGIWKNITEETMTTTRFTQFPTEWVTGDTICNIIYDTCWYAWKQKAARTDLTHSSLTFSPWLAADCKYEGENLTPSTRIAHGTNNRKEMIVITE